MCRQGSSSSYGVHILTEYSILNNWNKELFLPLILLGVEMKWLNATQFSVKVIGEQTDVAEISSFCGELSKHIFKNHLYLYT